MLISIITSTYNEYKKGELQRSVASVLAQTYPLWEMIIIGDCSPCGEKIERWIAKLNDARIRFLNLPKRAGVVSPGTIPKMEGVKLARGEYLAFLDADNVYFPKHLERCASEFEKNPSLDLVYGDTIVKMTNDQQGKLSLPMPNLSSFRWKKPEWSEKSARMLERVNFLDMSEPVFKMEAYEESGGLNPSHHAADWLLWRAMVKAGRNHFFHSAHKGLVYYTHTHLQHLSYFFLMLGQKSGIPYKSEKLHWMQRYIKRRFQNRYRERIP